MKIILELIPEVDDINSSTVTLMSV
jgi:hypothetical protein